MWNRRAIFDRLDVQPGSLQGGDGAFATASRTFHADFYFFDAKLHRLFGGGLSGTLSGKRRALSATFKAASASARPTKSLTFGVRDGHRGVVECRLDVSDAECYIPANAFLF